MRARPSTVELRGPMELVLYEGERAAFTCRASDGRPAPQQMEWTINRDTIPELVN